MSQYPKFLYARIVDPGTEDQFLQTGPELSDVDDNSVGESQSVALTAARYQLVGTGTIHHTAPRYVEDKGT